MLPQERLSNRAREARVALRLARLRAERGDQVHFPIPVTPFLLGMTSVARHDRTFVNAVGDGIRGRAKL